MRAFTIHTPQVASSVGGFILPGNKVDVLLTMTSNNPHDFTGGAVTTTILQNVEILAVDQRLDAPSENKVDPNHLQSVTLLVTPDQAAKLELGQNKGSLHLTLRNPEDSAAAKTQPATLSGLQFYQEKPWTERAKELIEAFGKLKSEKKAAAAAEPSDGPPPVLEIRTVRNTYSGVVQLEELSGKQRGR
jgi:pilus assembly protein CpaB